MKRKQGDYMKNIILFIKKNIKLIVISICLILVIGITEDVFEQEIMKCDTIAYNFFVNTIRSDSLTNIMKTITNLGSSFALIFITILTFVFMKDKKIPLIITGNLVIATLLNNIMKYIVQRPRPDGYRLISESGYSFPSGHSMISAAFYGLLIYLIYKYVDNKVLKYTLMSLLSILIILIGCSRIYLGVHYASDVIAGILISIIYLIIYIKVIDTHLRINK